MKTPNKILISSLSLIFLFCAYGQTNYPAPNFYSGGYDDFVFYKISSTPTMREFEETKAKVREFIWEHWNLQKEGKLKLEAYSKEGERSITDYLIECIENRICKVSVTIEREVVGRGKFEDRKSGKKVQFTAEKVDRVKIPTDYLSERQVIAENSKRSATSYWIRLKDYDEKILSEL